MHKILILNGPNLNMLGQREPEIYGTQTLAELEALCLKEARALELAIDFRQSNHEGELVTWIQEAAQGYAGLVINAAAYSHTSVALHDALKILTIPVIEVHLSDPKSREAFRHHSYVAAVAVKTIAGQGFKGYSQALALMKEILVSKF